MSAEKAATSPSFAAPAMKKITKILNSSRKKISDFRGGKPLGKRELRSDFMNRSAQRAASPVGPLSRHGAVFHKHCQFTVAFFEIKSIFLDRYLIIYTRHRETSLCYIDKIAIRRIQRTETINAPQEIIQTGMCYLIKKACHAQTHRLANRR